jgi:hypothetical protein
MTAGRPVFRIVPAKGTALFNTGFAVLFFSMFGLSVFRDFGSVMVNGHQVYGAERQMVLLSMSFFIIIPVSYLVWYGRRLLPGSPFDFLEIGPDGFTVRGLLGRHSRRWDEISGFSVGNILLSNQTIWIKVDSERPLRFFMGGYVRFKFFSRTKTRMRAIADWLDLVRRTYAFGDGTLPPPPPELAGTIISRTAETNPMRPRSSVIERR